MSTLDPKCEVCDSIAPEYLMIRCDNGCLVCESCICLDCADYGSLCQNCCIDNGSLCKGV